MCRWKIFLTAGKSICLKKKWEFTIISSIAEQAMKTAPHAEIQILKMMKKDIAVPPTQCDQQVVSGHLSSGETPQQQVHDKWRKNKK